MIELRIEKWNLLSLFIYFIFLLSKYHQIFFALKKLRTSNFLWSKDVKYIKFFLVERRYILENFFDLLMKEILVDYLPCKLVTKASKHYFHLRTFL